jgi:squalene-associated FAD-dependent desaturase
VASDAQREKVRLSGVSARRVAVIGGGWAGLAAAVECVEQGCAVTLYEMAEQLGGRARTVQAGDARLDNGQHILIGAYAETLRLMRRVGVDPERVLLRLPLQLIDAQGRGLVLGSGTPWFAFSRAVLRHAEWSMGERLRLLRAAGGWAVRGFRCDASASVADLTDRLGDDVRMQLIEPLCVAALNTPAPRASAEVFLRVLRDALFSARGSADLLLPRIPLSEIVPEPARRWLQARSAVVLPGQRAQAIEPVEGGWRVIGSRVERFDAVIVACSPLEAARLAAPHNPGWSQAARALQFEPIATVYVEAEGARLPGPITLLQADETAAPAQFAFDHGYTHDARGRLALVASGASAWVARGVPALQAAAVRQVAQLMAAPTQPRVRVVRTLVEKRATFVCAPGLDRPAARIAAQCWAAGDFVSGPYPATLEGAVRSGVAAGRAAAVAADRHARMPTQRRSPFRNAK